MEQLIKQIEQWAEDRNIIKGTRPIDQAMKLFSEFGELADNVGKGRDCRDDIGDVFVVLTIMAKQLNMDISSLYYEGYGAGSLKHAVVGLGGCLYDFVENQTEEHLVYSLNMLKTTCLESRNSLEDCVQIAYNDIKDRKGVVYNGLFVKESDPAYKDALIKLGKVQ